MDDLTLCRAALDAMRFSYSPYSGFKVGAAVLCRSGKAYTGCNIENAAFSPTICAERTAIFKAVSEGEKDFVKIAVAGGKDGIVSGAFPPCGVCRQVMAEFCGPDFEVLFVTGETVFEKHTLSQILPETFRL